MKLSVVLATRNEEENIGKCLAAVVNLADEIIVLDEHSTDKTREIAKRYGATVVEVDHHEIFHVTKQKAIDLAKGEWILQLDADEVVTRKLSQEIKEVISMSDEKLLLRTGKDKRLISLFNRHQKALEDRDGAIGTDTDQVVAFFIPRVNMFLGKPLIHGGVFPDGVIRLIKKGKAYLPAKSVHEQMVVEGRVSWLYESLEHYDSPTLRRYLDRFNRYTDLHALELGNNKVPKNGYQLLKWCTVKPITAFLLRYIRHAGYKDGMRGFLWATFSAWHYPIAYFKYFLGN